MDAYLDPPFYSCTCCVLIEIAEKVNEIYKETQTKDKNKEKEKIGQKNKVNEEKREESGRKRNHKKYQRTLG